jgi:hypothetical protein
LAIISLRRVLAIISRREEVLAIISLREEILAHA